MTEADDGVILALLERFNDQRLPRLLRIEEHVNAGNVLTEEQLAFLELIMEDSKKVRPLVDRHPEYNDLVGRAETADHSCAELRAF